MDTFVLPWVNGGQPFDLAATRLNPAAYKSATTAKNHALLEATKGLTSDTIPEVKDAILADAKTIASLAQMNALLYGALCAVDQKVAAMGMDAAMAKLDLDDYQKLAKAISKGLKVIKETSSPNADSPPN